MFFHILSIHNPVEISEDTSAFNNINFVLEFDPDDRDFIFIGKRYVLANAKYIQPGSRLEKLQIPQIFFNISNDENLNKTKKIKNGIGSLFFFPERIPKEDEYEIPYIEPRISFQIYLKKELLQQLVLKINSKNPPNGITIELDEHKKLTWKDFASYERVWDIDDTKDSSHSDSLTIKNIFFSTQPIKPKRPPVEFEEDEEYLLEIKKLEKLKEQHLNWIIFSGKFFIIAMLIMQFVITLKILNLF